MVTKTIFKTKDYTKVKFTYDDKTAESVKILGLNNDWNSPVEMSKKKDGTFSTEVSLPKNSQQEFKYLVNDAVWVNEPEADAQSSNGLGDSNSVINL